MCVCGTFSQSPSQSLAAAMAAVMLTGVCISFFIVSDRGMSEVLADFLGLNHAQQLGLDTRANIGFGPGHTSGWWVNSLLRLLHSSLHWPTCYLSTLPPAEHTHTYRHKSIVHSSLWRPTC